MSEQALQIKIQSLEDKLSEVAEEVKKIRDSGCQFNRDEMCKGIVDDLKEIRKNGCSKAKLHEMEMKQMQELMKSNVARFEVAMSKFDKAIEENKQTLRDSTLKAQRNDVYMEIGRAVIWLIVVGFTGVIFYWMR